MWDAKVTFGQQLIEIQSPTVDTLLKDFIAVINNEISERLDLIEEEFSASCEADEDYWRNRASELVTLRDHVSCETQFSQLAKYNFRKLLDMKFEFNYIQ